MLLKISSKTKFEKYFKEGIKGEMIVLNSYNRRANNGMFEKVTLKDGRVYYIFLHNIGTRFSPFRLLGCSFEREFIKEEGLSYSELLKKINDKNKTNFTCFDSVDEYGDELLLLKNDIKFDLNISEEFLYFNEEYRDLYEEINYVIVPLNSDNKKELIQKYHIENKRDLFIGIHNIKKPVFYEVYLNEGYYGSNDSGILTLEDQAYPNQDGYVLSRPNAQEDILKKGFNNTTYGYYISENDKGRLYKPSYVVSLKVSLEELKEIDKEKYNSYFEGVELLFKKIEYHYQKNLSSIKKLNQEDFNNLKKVEERFIEDNSQFIKMILGEKIGRSTGVFFEGVEKSGINFDNVIKTYLKTIENNKLELLRKEEEKKIKLQNKKKEKASVKSNCNLNNKFIVTSSGSFTGFIERTYEVEIPRNQLEEMSKEEIEEYLKNNYSEGIKINESISIDDDYSEYTNFVEKSKN